MLKNLSLISVLVLNALMLTAAVQAAEGDPVHGKALFKKHCTACHTIMKGATPDMYGVVLPLHGIIGREAAQTKGFFYSKALRNSNIVWSEDILDQYIKDPKGTIPGIRMEFYGLESGNDRQDIISYLFEQQKNQ